MAPSTYYYNRTGCCTCVKFLVQGRSSVPNGSLRSRADVDVCDEGLPCTQRCVCMAITFQCSLPGPLHRSRQSFAKAPRVKVAAMHFLTLTRSKKSGRHHHSHSQAPLSVELQEKWSVYHNLHLGLWLSCPQYKRHLTTGQHCLCVCVCVCAKEMESVK